MGQIGARIAGEVRRRGSEARIGGAGDVDLRNAPGDNV